MLWFCTIGISLLVFSGSQLQLLLYIAVRDLILVTRLVCVVGGLVYVQAVCAGCGASPLVLGLLMGFAGCCAAVSNWRMVTHTAFQDAAREPTSQCALERAHAWALAGPIPDPRCGYCVGLMETCPSIKCRWGRRQASQEAGVLCWSPAGCSWRFCWAQDASILFLRTSLTVEHC